MDIPHQTDHEVLNSEQTVTCIWHRQSDTMMWWPQNLKECNSELALTSYLRQLRHHRHKNVSLLIIFFGQIKDFIFMMMMF